MPVTERFRDHALVTERSPRRETIRNKKHELKMLRRKNKMLVVGS